MHSLTHAHAPAFASLDRDTGSRAARITGKILGGLAVAFLLLDAVGKLMMIQPVIDGAAELGYPAETMLPIGALLLLCTITYAVPRTAALGAVLLTGYLGGAIATHVRVGNPLASHTLFPVYLAALVWGALFLRDARLRVLLPWRA